ncbi:MAG: iron ABC transporter permease [Acidimicrobiaceae bacterium]|nr:iron ABC transporter permease [Acidimicrobiaceae bacterium]
MSETSPSGGVLLAMREEHSTTSTGIERRNLRHLYEVALNRLGRPLLWVVLAVVSIIPTVAFLALAFSPRIFSQGSSWFTLSAFRQAFSGVEFAGMRNSLIIAVGAALIATLIASGLALIAQRTDLRIAKWIPALLWGVLLVPTYVVSVGWEEILSSGNLFSQIGLVTPFMRSALLGPVGIILILAFSGVPFAYFAMAPAIVGMGRRFEEASRIHGAGVVKTTRIVAPIILPAIFAAMIIVFAESIGDFGVASTIAANANFPVATTNIMAAIGTFPTNFPEAAAVGWFLVLTLASVLTIQNWLLRKKNYAVLSGRSSFAPRSRPAGRQRAALNVFAYGFFTVTLVIPAMGAVFSTLLKPYSTFSWSNLSLSAYSDVFTKQSILQPIMVSLKMSVITASLTVILGVAVAKVLTSPRPGWTGRLTDAVLVGSVALPALVLAAGFIFVFNLPFTVHLGINLYGTMTLLGMGYLAISLPSNSRVLIGPMSQIDGSLMAAGRIHGAHQLRAFRKCVLPLIAKSLLWAWLLSFAATFGELPTSVMLAPTGVRTMATAILSSFQAYNFAMATAFSVVQMIIVLSVIATATLIFRFVAPPGWRNIEVRRT